MTDKTTNTRWEHFPHAADIGIRGIGPKKEAAFEQAALAMTACLTDLSAIDAAEQIEFACQGPDDELLLVDFLNTLLYEMSTRDMLFSKFKVEINAGSLGAAAWGQKIDIKKHSPAVEVKGASYTELKVAKKGENWFAQCIVDV